MKIGLFFGTFDPVHHGHVSVAKSVLNKKNIDQLWVIVSPLSPFKQGRTIVDFFHRKKMLEKAFEGYSNILVSDIEYKLKRPNYTIETLLQLRKKYPKFEFSIILGADNFKSIHLWKSYKLILDSYPIFIYPRKGFPLKDLHLNFPDSRICVISMQNIPISSSLIRDNIFKEEFTHYLNPKVREYILEKKLYQV